MRWLAVAKPPYKLRTYFVDITDNPVKNPRVFANVIGTAMKIPRDFADGIGTAMKNPRGFASGIGTAMKIPRDFANVIGNIEIISIHHLNISPVFQLKKNNQILNINKIAQQKYINDWCSAAAIKRF